MKDKIFCNLRKKNPLGWVGQSWVKKAQGNCIIWIPKILKPNPYSVNSCLQFDDWLL